MDLTGPVSDFAAFYLQEIGALLFGLVFLFLYRQSRVVYFGLWSIAWLLRFLRTRSTAIFVVYRVLLGAALLVLLTQGVLEP